MDSLHGCGSTDAIRVAISLTLVLWTHRVRAVVEQFVVFTDLEEIVNVVDNSTLILIAQIIIQRQPYQPIAFRSRINVLANEPSPLVEDGTVVQGYVVRRARDTYFLHVFCKFPPVPVLDVSITIPRGLLRHVKKETPEADGPLKEFVNKPKRDRRTLRRRTSAAWYVA